MHRIINTRPLRFQNPYFTSGFRKVYNFSYRSPIYNGDISQGEVALQQQMIEKLQKMKNEGLIKKAGDKDGDTNHDGKIDMEALSKMGINTMIMPEGVTNVREAEKQREATRQIERFNADILSKKQEDLKKLYQQARRQRQVEEKRRLIKFLAESAEIEEIPAEYQEAVKAYYEGKDLLNNDAESTKDKKDSAISTKEYIKEMDRRQKQKAKVDAARKVLKEKRLKKEAEEYQPWGARPVREYHSYGYGMVPRISHMVQPFFSLDSQLEVTPANIVEDTKNSLDDRRRMYKEYQVFQRGIEPSKEMVKRAMPETAEPMKVDEAPPKKIEIVPHPFLYKTNKFPILKLRKFSGRKPFYLFNN